MPDRVDTPRRRSLRLQAYDYRQAGAYFVTLCAHHRACLFGEIADAVLAISADGEAAVAAWEEIPVHFPNVELDAYVLMPNHIHGILVINAVGARHASPQMDEDGFRARHASPLLGTIVGSYKSAVARRINAQRGTPGASVWQRSYFEHVIRSEASLERIREYIAANPARWADDAENPARSPLHR